MIFHCSAEFTIVQERRMCYTEIPCGHSGISRGAEPGCWHLSEGFTTLFSARSPPKNKICACDGIGRHARFRFSCSNACGFESLQAHHVVADFISFATTFYFKKSSLIHSVAPPFQIEPASLGFDLVLGADLKAGASKLFALSTSEQSPLCSDVLLFLHLAVMRHVFPFWSYKNL